MNREKESVSGFTGSFLFTFSKKRHISCEIYEKRKMYE